MARMQTQREVFEGELSDTLKLSDGLKETSEKYNATTSQVASAWALAQEKSFPRYLVLPGFRCDRYRDNVTAGGSSPPWRTSRLLERLRIQPTLSKAIVTLRMKSLPDDTPSPEPRIRCLRHNRTTEHI